MAKNYYETLGVQKNATQDEIKKAFRSLSKKYHPDVCKEPDAEEKFKEINEAYNVLNDKEKRQMFDTYGTIDPNEINQGSGGGFDPFGGGFDPFEGFNPFGRSGGGFHQQQMKEKGDDLRITIEMSFDELFYGAHKKIKITKNCTCHRCHGSGSETNETCECTRCGGSGMVTEVKRFGNSVMQSTHVCQECHGTGRVIKDPCPSCHGTGLEKKQADVEFDVPAGMYSDAYFLVRGKGGDGPHRGTPGDLLVVVKEKPNDYGLTRDDKNNILYTKKVPYKTMVFGGDVTLPYVGGQTQKIHIEQGTESGKKLKLYGKGFPDPNTPANKADYIVTIECEIPKPKNLSTETKEMIKKLPD